MITELRARLYRELDHLIDELTVVIPARLGTDQGYDDYRDTLVLQQLIQERIQYLRRVMGGLERVDPATLQADVAGLGAVVYARDLESGEHVQITITADDRGLGRSGDVFFESPAGAALVGRRVGDEIVMPTPRGRRRLQILSVTTLSETLGADPPAPAAVQG